MSRYFQTRLVFEKLCAAILLLLLSPLILIAVILVASDGGPILFTQTRLGLNAKKFKVYKLRTMIENADTYLDVNGNPSRNRITKFGGFLRKSSIDELPQLVNILKGEMAVIGPRPILPSMYSYMKIQEKNRFSIRPGITGLAQVKGRNKILWSNRFRYDNFYISRAGVLLDLYILIETLKVVIIGSDISMDRNAGIIDDIRIRKIYD